MKKKTKPTAKKAVTPKALEAVSRPFEVLGKRARPAKANDEAAPVVKAAKPTPSPRSRALPVDAVDEAAFAIHMRGVAPLPRKALRIPATASQIESPGRADAVRAPTSEREAVNDDDAPKPVAAGIEVLDALVTGALRFELVDDGRLLEGRRLDVDPRELRRLRTQRYSIDGKLDLHGQSLDGARLAVERYVERRRIQGDRALLIVHGKGLHSARGVGILRAELGAWLSQGRAAKDVLAFASLEDDDGHSGALMVLLAKR